MRRSLIVVVGVGCSAVDGWLLNYQLIDCPRTPRIEWPDGDAVGCSGKL